MAMWAENDSRKDRLKRNVEFVLLAILVSAVFGTALFVWKRGSDRAACIMNIRNVQQAVRGHSGVMGMLIDTPLAWSDIVGHGKYLDKIECPAGGTYRFHGRIPKVGELAVECSLCNTPQNHKPDKYSDW